MSFVFGMFLGSLLTGLFGLLYDYWVHSYCRNDYYKKEEPSALLTIKQTEKEIE